MGRSAIAAAALMVLSAASPLVQAVPGVATVAGAELLVEAPVGRALPTSERDVGVGAGSLHAVPDEASSSRGPAATGGHPVPGIDEDRATPPAGTGWRGTAARDANVRSAPHRTAPLVRELKAGEPVRAIRWVSGDEIEPDNTTWAEIAPGQFVFGMLLRTTPPTETPAPPPGAPTAGRWVDVNLTLQVATAYEGRQAVRSTLISAGRPGWDTPEGTSRILRRVEKETMDGATLRGQGPDGKGASYRVENVRWTQYFTPDGAAIHENSWRRRDAFGMPGSHGCIGMPPEEAAWFWSWAQVGTPLVVHR